jgi:2,3-dihydroxybenzoate decarboxylase
VHVCHRYVHIHSDHKELRLMIVDTPYETVEEAQNWWKAVDLPADQKEAVARTNAIRLFKLPLEV